MTSSRLEILLDPFLVLDAVVGADVGVPIESDRFQSNRVG